jgi:ribosomal protein S18 acetylase RimI-like enzyme
MSGCRCHAVGLDRFADRTNERSEHCEHCGARVRVLLRSAAEVRRRRRAHRLLWPVWAALVVLSAWGLVQVVRTGDGRGYDDLFGLFFTAAATVLLGYSTLRSLVLTQGFDTPVVTRTDDREPYGVQHGWTTPRPVDSHDRTP